MNMHIIYHLKKKLLLFEDLYIFFESENKREINLRQSNDFSMQIKGRGRRRDEKPAIAKLLKEIGKCTLGKVRGWQKGREG